MAKNIFRLVFVISVFDATIGAHLPNYIKACSKTDPNFNKCAQDSANAALKSMRDGDRKYNIQSLNPYIIISLVLDLGANLKFSIFNTSTFGIADVVVTNIRSDFDKRTMGFEAYSDVFTITGQYEMSGKLVIMDINGKGDYNVTFTKVKYTYECEWEPKTKKGEDFIEIKHSSVLFVPEHGYYHFDNLFQGNDAMGENINQVLNDNWEAAYNDFKIGFGKAMAAIVDTYFQGFFNVVPMKEIFLE